MRSLLQILIFILVTVGTLSLASCKNEEPAKEVKKKSSMTEEKADEEVKY